jgi:hypothetical protein
MKKLLVIALSILILSLASYSQNNCKEISSPSSEGLLFITNISGGISKNGFVDTTGKVKIEPKFDEAYSFSNGRALVKVNDKYGFIDQDGKLIIKPEFDNACSFSEKLASVKINGKYGYIDKNGVIKIPPQFDNAFNFSEGLAKIKVFSKVDPTKDILEENYGYIDKEGKSKIPAIFDAASDFRGGVAKVVDSIFGLETYINTEGKIIFRKINLPIEVFAAAPDRLDVSIESNPAKAKIYLIPTKRWDCNPANSKPCDPTLLSKDEASLSEFIPPVDSTPASFKAKQKKYTVLFFINGKKVKEVPLDVTPGASNSVSVNLQ